MPVGEKPKGHHVTKNATVSELHPGQNLLALFLKLRVGDQAWCGTAARISCKYQRPRLVPASSSASTGGNLANCNASPSGGEQCANGRMGGMAKRNVRAMSSLALGARTIVKKRLNLAKLLGRRAIAGRLGGHQALVGSLRIEDMIAESVRILFRNQRQGETEARRVSWIQGRGEGEGGRDPVIVRAGDGCRRAGPAAAHASTQLPALRAGADPPAATPPSNVRLHISIP